MMSDWSFHLLSLIDNDTKLELGNSTAASHRKAVKMLSASVTQHFADDFRPEVSFHPTTIPLGADKTQRARQTL